MSTTIHKVVFLKRILRGIRKGSKCRHRTIVKFCLGVEMSKDREEKNS